MREKSRGERDYRGTDFTKSNVTNSDSAKVGPLLPAVLERSLRSLKERRLLIYSLQSLYDYQPITLTISGALFSHTLPCLLKHQHAVSWAQPITISLRTPDADTANWALHASSIWVSSVYLTDHIDKLDLEFHMKSRFAEDPIRMLELGASAGLPSTAIAKMYPMLLVTATDYPDEGLLRTLSGNVEKNGVAQRCRVMSFDWATDPSHILQDNQKFDVVIAANTLWNPGLHSIFIKALRSTTKKASSSRFLNKVMASGFQLESLEEMSVSGSVTRTWQISREAEDD
ncbi:hypothetical protein CPB84DRAFT_1813878 [Gymnopilus junonius]|uniref:Uncharacterized protein n=1 Tax=Gymnopilus junonius TaxID=109634 RepID=A0A9P5NV51_GYMJU|nr:hypothetical protein CPB84DRAFT_1813878 [Gymnopilus junonius]